MGMVIRARLWTGSLKRNNSFFQWDAEKLLIKKYDKIKKTGIDASRCKSN
jgi:hypothetical protein